MREEGKPASLPHQLWSSSACRKSQASLSATLRCNREGAASGDTKLRACMCLCVRKQSNRSSYSSLFMQALHVSTHAWMRVFPSSCGHQFFRENLWLMCFVLNDGRSFSQVYFGQDLSFRSIFIRSHAFFLTTPLWWRICPLQDITIVGLNLKSSC